MKDLFLRKIFELWARSGKAHGYLYNELEKRHQSFEPTLRTRRTYNGLTFECNLLDHVQRQIYFFGAYEPLEITLLLSLIQPGSTVVDAGANIGFYSLMLSQHIEPSGKVFSFEPIPENFEQLSRHIALNGIQNVIAIQKALWNKLETLQFGLAPKNKHNAGGFNAAEKGETLKTLQCEAVPLGEFLKSQGIAKIDALKMDIEGAELMALTGARELIADSKPVICLEVCRSTCAAFGYEANDLWNFFKPHGYRPYAIGDISARSGWIENFSSLEQRNVLLIPNHLKNKLNENWDARLISQKYLKYS